MIPDGCLRLHLFVERHRKGAIAGFLALGVAGLLGLRAVSYNGSVESMLPDGSEIQRQIRFLRESEFAAKAVISVRRVDPAIGKAQFLAAVDELVRKLDGPLIRKVIGRVDAPDALDDLRDLLRFAPQMVGAEELVELEKRLSPEGVDELLRRKYLELLKPGGSIVEPWIRSDPFGLGAGAMKRIGALQASFGYDVRIDEGHLLSRDGNHAMILLDTVVPVTDGFGSRELLSWLSQRLEALPAGIEADIIGGHQHTVSNERVIRRDVAVTNSAGTAALLVLLFLVFRDPKVAVVFLVPIVAIVVAINLTGLMIGELAYWAVGLASTIVGIAVDFGVHTYVAVRYGGDAGRAVGDVVKPLLLCAATTACVFVAFAFSGVQGYQQLAALALTSLALAVLGSLFILPHMVVPGRPAIQAARPAPARWSRATSLAVVAATAVLVAGAAWSARGVRFDGDLARLDGTEAPVLDGEERFNRTWTAGGSGNAIAVVYAGSREEAADRIDLFYGQVAEVLGPSGVSGLPSFWPGPARRAENRERWRRFWSAERVAEVQALFRSIGGKYSFAPEAFDPFFSIVGDEAGMREEPSGNGLFERLSDRFLQQAPDGWRAMLFFPDTARDVRLVEAVCADFPDVLVVSARTVSRSLSTAMSRTIVEVFAVSVALIVLVLMPPLGGAWPAFVATIPSLVGAAGLLGVMAWLGQPLNVANLIAGAMAIGLCVDYGVFIMHAHGSDKAPQVRLAVTLSMLTTVIGAGALLFARHPALFSIGLSLVIGVLAGYAAAMTAVPAMCELVPSVRRGGGHA